MRVTSETIESVRIVAIKPFSRWAIIPVSQIHRAPALTFYRRSAAEKEAREYLRTNNDIIRKRVGMDPDVVLLIRKRPWHRFTLEDELV